jgi:hypothetical protein
MPEKVKPKHFNKVSKSTMPKKPIRSFKHTVDYLPSSNMAHSAIFDEEDRFNGEGYFDLNWHMDRVF